MCHRLHNLIYMLLNPWVWLAENKWDQYHIVTHLSMTMPFVLKLNQSAHRYHSFNKWETKSHLGHSHQFAWLVVHPITDFEINLLNSTSNSIKAYKYPCREPWWFQVKGPQASLSHENCLWNSCNDSCSNPMVGLTITFVL